MHKISARVALNSHFFVYGENVISWRAYASNVKIKLTYVCWYGDPPNSILDTSNDLNGMVATLTYKVDTTNCMLNRGSRDDDFTRVIYLVVKITFLCFWARYICTYHVYTKPTQSYDNYTKSAARSINSTKK